MGISKEAFQTSEGFGNIHPGEDPDLAIRLWNLGYQTALIPDATVFHKRRISWRTFYIQVNKFGKVRPILNLWHPETARMAYWLPTLFIGYTIFSLVSLVMGYGYFMSFLLLYFVIIFIGATVQYKSIRIGVTSVIAVLIQFYGYGSGFLKSYYYIHLLNKVPEQKFKYLFF